MFLRSIFSFFLSLFLTLLLAFLGRFVVLEDDLLASTECRLNTTETNTLLWKLAHC